MKLDQARAFVLAAFAAAFLAACDNPRAASAAPATEPAATAPRTYPTAGDDFYRHVNGKWIDEQEIPSDKANVSVSGELADQAEIDIRTIAEELAASSPPPGSTRASIADFYASMMDTDTIEARGIEPLKPFLDHIAEIETRDDLVNTWGELGYASPVSFGAGTHPDRTDETALWIGQSGLGMPHSGYYLDAGFRAEGTRRAYRKLLTATMELLGRKDPAAAAERVYALERRIAEAHTATNPSQSMQSALQSMTLGELQKYAPAIDWKSFLGRAGYGDAKTFVITDGTAVRDCVKLADEIPLESWKDWMAFQLAYSSAVALPKSFQEKTYAFAYKELLGIEKPPERWRIAVASVNGYLGYAVGELYVEKHFPRENKTQVETMVASIRTAFAARLDKLDWMDEATRAEAHVKLKALGAFVGYPDKPLDRPPITFDRGKLFENMFKVGQASVKLDQERLTRPVDRAEWPVPPQVVNAYYHPFSNRLCLPAAILQPPFFDPSADPAENYGGIGAVIGHELSHGFDDEGRQMDERGARRNWWTRTTNTKFLVAAGRLTSQYNAYCPSLGNCLNGLATLGENIADLAGLETAYDAYHASLGGREAPVIDGRTGDQRFFLAFARQYREKTNARMLRLEVDGGSHAPSQYRVNGVVRNMDAWYAAFDIKEGDKLYLKPEMRVRIW